jgi:regulator of RNase E activity RraA
MSLDPLILQREASTENRLRVSSLNLEAHSLLKIKEKACSGMFSDFTDGDGKTRIRNNFRSTSGQNVFGIVRTVELESIITHDENLVIGLPFLTSLDNGDVLVVKGADGFAYFGELMANLAKRTGVNGTIIFGASRDSRAISRLDYPLYATSFTPIDIKGRGRVKAVDVQLEIDSYTIDPLSWVFADSDGAVFFPNEIAEAVLSGVLVMIDSEQEILSQIAQGLSGEQLAKIHEGF